ncbi:MAG: DUF4830 domain-containing protein [Oscillospiraceae bacterium]|nr:DUF4830 domain-containing protein [Oscillospiraceae bacterium]
MKIKLYISALTCIIFICIVFCAYGRDKDSEICRVFLEGFGWQTEEKLFDRVDVRIPEKFDAVYENYNKIQHEAKLDLAPYCGKSGVRYTFVVTNYPIDVGEPVYANVICIDGEPVAGDIMTVSVSGFMHSLDKGLAEDS